MVANAGEANERILFFLRTYADAVAVNAGGAGNTDILKRLPDGTLTTEY